MEWQPIETAPTGRAVLVYKANTQEQYVAAKSTERMGRDGALLMGLNCSRCLTGCHFQTRPQSYRKDFSAMAKQAEQWEIYEGGNFVRVGRAGYREWCDANGHMGGPLAICDVEERISADHEPTHETAMRYARMIHAIPDLLEALRFYVAVCGNTCAVVSRESAQLMYDTAQKAFAKAGTK